MSQSRVCKSDQNENSSSASTLPHDIPNEVSNQGTATESPEAEIRLRAYRRWEKAGCPCGDGSEFWFAAERELGRTKPR